MKEVCGTCKYNKYNSYEQSYYCGNEDSDYYGIDTAYDDECEEWEDKDE